MEITDVGADGSVTVKLTAAEAMRIRDDLYAAGTPWDASYTLSRHIAQVFGEPEAVSR